MTGYLVPHGDVAALARPDGRARRPIAALVERLGRGGRGSLRKGCRGIEQRERRWRISQRTIAEQEGRADSCASRSPPVIPRSMMTCARTRASWSRRWTPSSRDARITRRSRSARITVRRRLRSRLHTPRGQRPRRQVRWRRLPLGARPRDRAREAAAARREGARARGPRASAAACRTLVRRVLKVATCSARKGDPLQLELLTGEVGLEREMRSSEASSPGLVLAGYTARFRRHRPDPHPRARPRSRISRRSTPRRGARSIETFFSYDLPCVVITKGQEAPAELLELVARDSGIPVIRTRLKTAEFYRRLKPFLDDAFAPRTTVHGSLADVFGVGLLFRGRSGIGKSECVLDLVERGHRLVADDVVHITRRGNDVLIGRGHEISRHYMEIRGVGSDRHQCAVRHPLRAPAEAHRGRGAARGLGQHRASTTARASTSKRPSCSTCALPLVTVPLNPGKNLTVICEVVAMNHLLRYSGVDSAQRVQRAPDPAHARRRASCSSISRKTMSELRGVIVSHAAVAPGARRRGHGDHRDRRRADARVQRRLRHARRCAQRLREAVGEGRPCCSSICPGGSCFTSSARYAKQAAPTSRSSPV